MEELHINASPLRCTIRDDTSSAWSSSLSQYGHPRIGLTAGGGGLPPRHTATDCERLAGDGSFEIIDGQQRTISICKFVEGDFAFQKRYFHNLQNDEDEDWFPELQSERNTSHESQYMAMANPDRNLGCFRYNGFVPALVRNEP
jgi:hypothetical protein